MGVPINEHPIRRRPHTEKFALHRFAEYIVQTVHEAIVILSSDLRVMWANRSFYKTFQVGPMETEGRLIFDLGNGQWNMPQLKTLLEEMFARSIEFKDFEVDHDFLSIGRRTMLLNAAKLDSQSNNPDMILLAIEDITERKRVEADQFKLHLDLKKANEALRALALVDDLTGLYNRRGFLTFAEQQMKLARRNKRELLLVFLDLDGLKQINDSLGHQEGDRALVKTAEILKQTFHRDLDIIARLSGDEFVALTIDSFLESPEIICTRLQEHLKKTNAQANCAYQLSFCLGMTRFNLTSNMTINDLMAEADEALYKKKRARTSPEKLAMTCEGSG